LRVDLSLSLSLYERTNERRDDEKKRSGGGGRGGGDAARTFCALSTFSNFDMTKDDAFTAATKVRTFSTNAKVKKGHFCV